MFRPQRINAEQLTKAKSLGFSDRHISHLTGTTEDVIRHFVRFQVGESAA